MIHLSKRQREILTYISEMVKERGYPPTVREIGDAVGLASSSTVHGHLRRLEAKGYIKRDPTKPRAIELIVQPSYQVIVKLDNENEAIRLSQRLSETGYDVHIK